MLSHTDLENTELEPFLAGTFENAEESYAEPCIAYEVKSADRFTRFTTRLLWDLDRKHWIVVGVAMLIIILFMGLGFGISKSNVDTELSDTINEIVEPSNNEYPESILGNFSKAAIAADGGSNVCPKIGR